MFVLLVQQGSHLLNHIVVNVAIAGECLGAFAVAGELTDEIGVFHLLIEVADEGTAGHVRAGNVADRMLLRLLGPRVDDGHDTVDACLLQRLADKVVEFAGAVEGEDGTLVLSFVALQDLDGGGCQVDLYYARAFLFSFGRHILHGDAVVSCDDVVLGEREEIADTAADVALEDEDVPSLREIFVLAHIRLVQKVSFLGGEVVGGTVLLRTDGILAEWIVLRVAHIHAPAPIGTHGAHVTDDGVVASLAGRTFVLGVVPGIFVLLDGTETDAVFHLVRLEEGVLGAEEVLEGHEGVRGGLVENDLLAGVQLEAVDDAEDCLVGVDTLLRDLLVLEEIFGLVQQAQLVAVRLGVVLGEEETVDGILRPVLVEFVDGLVVALLDDVVDNLLYLCLGFKGVTDFGSDDAVLDEDFAVGEVLRKDVRMGVSP